jgi:hypothetical protein
VTIDATRRNFDIATSFGCHSEPWSISARKQRVSFAPRVKLCLVNSCQRFGGCLTREIVFCEFLPKICWLRPRPGPYLR